MRCSGDGETTCLHHLLDFSNGNRPWTDKGGLNGDLNVHLKELLVPEFKVRESWCSSFSSAMLRRYHQLDCAERLRQNPKLTASEHIVVVLKSEIWSLVESS